MAFGITATLSSSSSLSLASLLSLWQKKRPQQRQRRQQQQQEQEQRKRRDEECSRMRRKSSQSPKRDGARSTIKRFKNRHIDDDEPQVRIMPNNNGNIRRRMSNDNLNLAALTSTTTKTTRSTHLPSSSFSRNYTGDSQRSLATTSSTVSSASSLSYETTLATTSKTATTNIGWRKQEDWVDSQVKLNQMADRIEFDYNHRHHYSHTSLSPSPASTMQHVKVMETFNGSINMGPLLSVLPKSHVATLCLVGVQLQESNSRLLAAALCDPQTPLTTLQLCRLSPWGVSALATALSFNRQLKELRLTFHHDISLRHISQLTNAIQNHNTTLTVFQLYCANLQGPASSVYLANMLAHNKTLKECRLTGCNIHELQPLATAIQQSNTLERLDLSMNRITDTESIRILLETPSLRFIDLSENDLGTFRTCNTIQSSSSVTQQYQQHQQLLLTKALAQNKSLEYLSLDMNPVSHDVVHAFHKALQLHNTTLRQLCLLTLSIPPKKAFQEINYWIAMNRAGRGTLRQAAYHNNPSSTAGHLVLPHMLSAVSLQPSLLFGMLTEVPHLWI